MRNFRLTIEYDGTDYNGWQAQSSTQRRKGGRVKTVQGILEGAFLKLFSKKIKIVSCSRTDSGVHAKSHVANFKAPTKLSSCQIKKALNSLLPEDILIRAAEEEVGPGFNSQYDALSKTYRYVICNQNYASPFLRRYVYHFREPLDVSLMRNAAKPILGKHDFSAFRSSNKNHKEGSNCRRTIKRLEIRKKGKLIEVEIEADGFLYNMVRNIVGTLIEIGRGKFPPGSIEKILRSKDRRTAGPTAPAKGLCLINVRYN